MKEFLVFWISFYIGSGLGYDRILNFDKGGCAIVFYYLSEHESYLVTWNGTMNYSACEAYFRGRNFDQEHTTFRVCFKTLDYHFASRCETKIEFIEGIDEGPGDGFDCNSSIPSTWCTKQSDHAQLKIKANYDDPGSRLKLEVTVTAVTIEAGVGIVIGCVAFICITATVCIVYMTIPDKDKCWKSQKFSKRCRRNRSTVVPQQEE